MSQKNRYQLWIDVGYELFSKEGYDFVQVERLARIVSGNKSGFYHYFGDRETYMEHIARHHLKIAQQFRGEVTQAKSLVPDYINTLLRYEEFVMVSMRMSVSNHIPLLRQTSQATQEIVRGATLPLWAAYLDMENDAALAARFYDITKDALNVRMTTKNFTFGFFQDVLTEARSIAQELKIVGLNRSTVNSEKRAVA